MEYGQINKVVETSTCKLIFEQAFLNLEAAIMLGHVQTFSFCIQSLLSQ